ncbi:hypothetical protein [Phreatobacter stygius]|uniref:Uncharacterized protein n=1 Tax=Phreatobacter stygius TaxID=1940610 RepID=A0A4D7AYW2_9HYPH|nr:hypothetical protein [Phreatobacter stygius]QCI63858.1 hypothetical protein E8M01_06135 [Phreatobacter stygius]
MRRFMMAAPGAASRWRFVSPPEHLLAAERTPAKRRPSFCAPSRNLAGRAEMPLRWQAVRRSAPGDHPPMGSGYCPIQAGAISAFSGPAAVCAESRGLSKDRVSPPLVQAGWPGNRGWHRRGCAMTVEAGQGQPIAGTEPIETPLFQGGPPHRVQSWIGLVRPGRPNVLRRALLAVLVGWVPLFLLVALQSGTAQTGGLGALLLDCGFHARSLIAVPLLILAEVSCARQLGAIIRQFGEARLVREQDRIQFDQAIASTRSLLWSPRAELVALVLTFLMVVALMTSVHPEHIPSWQKSAGAVEGLSAAGWWHALVSLPLLLVLFIGWLWRLALWTRLLWLISRLDLRLVASHPDHAAGLMFVGHSLRAFAVVALATSAIVAGRFANEILANAAFSVAQQIAAVSPLVVVLGLLAAPVVMFTGTLAGQARRGVFDYGKLAGEVGQQFEARWIKRDRKVSEDALEAPDFSATTDLYQVVANAQSIRIVPIDLQSIIMLVASMVLPFIPVMLMKVPIDVVLHGLKGLLL